jgi:hypothetical protein
MSQKRYQKPAMFDFSKQWVKGQSGPDAVCVFGDTVSLPVTCAPLGHSPVDPVGVCAPTGSAQNRGGCAVGSHPYGGCIEGSIFG